MHKIGQIVKTVLIFLCILLLICFFISMHKLVNNQISTNELFSKTVLYFLYTIGYGSLEDKDTIFQNILAMLGIVSLALMTTHLTINLFWRIDDVKLNKTALFNDKNLLFEFKNFGRNICDVKATFVLYDSVKSENIGEPKEYCMPILIKKSRWNLEVDLNETFWYKSLYNLLTNEKQKLYCTFSFVDVKTGQSSIRVQEIKRNNIINNGHILKYEEFVKPYILPYKELHPCGNNSSVSIDDIEGNAIINYIFKPYATINNFSMAFYDFNGAPMNFEKYNRSTTYFEFSASSNTEVELKFEIKHISNAKFCRVYKINEESQIIKIPFIEIDNPLDSIKEICYTVFKENNPKKANLQISNLVIHTK